MAVKVKSWLSREVRVLNGDGYIIIPVLWMAENVARNNLQITMSLEKLVKSERLSDRILHDIIMDVATDTFRFDGAMYWLYSTADRCWSGVFDVPTKRDEGNFINLKVFVNGAVKGVLPLNSPYINDGRGVNPRSEYNFNKLHCDYFYGKFPIRLKTMCPACGESALTTVEVVGENRKSTSANQAHNFSDRFTSGIHLLDK